MRKRIYEIIEVSHDDDKVSFAYDIIMMLVIILSLLPLAFKQTNTLFTGIDRSSTVIFIIDYLLRLITADHKLDKKTASAFFIYPFTPMAIIDLVVILSSFSFISSGFKVLKIMRLTRTFRVFRVAKFLRYSKNLVIILTVLKKQRKALGAVAALASAYILVSALVIFNVEPDSFNTFFDAVYWATISLTTVGYGDIYPTSTLGRIVTMVSSVFGIAIIALPSGIITGGYLTELNNNDNKSNDK